MERIATEEKISRFRSFYEMNLADGPLVGFFLGTYYPLHRYRGAVTLPDGPLRPADIDPTQFKADYLRLQDEYRAVEGDTIWAGSVFWGLPWLEALIGCDVVADHTTGSTRSIHPHRAPGLDEIPAFDPVSEWARTAGGFLDLLADDTMSFPLGTTLMRGFSDMLSALYGTPEFVYRLVDRGNDIEGIIDKLADIWIDFADFQIDRFPDYYGGTGSYFYNMWMPGRGGWIQEDAAALLSPELFEPLILPALERVISHFDSMIIHLHPTGYIPVDLLACTGLAAIELHVDRGGPTAEELLPYYRKIQAQKPLIIWGDLSETDLSFIRNNLDTRSLTLLPVVKTVEEAESKWGILKN